MTKEQEKRLEDITYEEWRKYYKESCEQDCVDGKKCRYRIGSACLGDIIDTGDKKATLREVLEDSYIYLE